MDSKRLKNLLISLAGPLLLTALLLAGMLSSLLLSRRHDRISRQLEEAVWCSLSGSWEEARDVAGEARDSWQESWHFQAMLGDHSPMEEIDTLFSQLVVYGAAEEETDFGATCAALSRHMQAMGDAQRLTWWNIL